MPELRTIEIDFDIHRLIEHERRGFDEPEYVALRRLLGLPARTDNEKEFIGRPWQGREGVKIPHGEKLRMHYNGTKYTAIIDDGVWKVNGDERSYNSPSAAAGAAVKIGTGKHISLNGWNYWEIYIQKESRWRKIADLRK